MSTSRKRLLWAFSAATALLTLVLLAVEEKRSPPPRPRPPGLATPLPEDEATLRIGFFSIGPNDIEPRLVDEVILGLDTPVRVDLSHRSTRARYEHGTGWSVGVHAPGLLSWPVEWTLEEGEDPFHLEAQLEVDEDGKRIIDCSLDAMFAGGGSRGEIRLEAGPAVRVLVDSVGWECEDDWRTDFVLGTTEGKTTGHWDLERWRAAIVEGLGLRDRYRRDRDAHALIPCPAAREELGDGLERAELTARLLAGDPRATANADDMTVSLLRSGLRTIWLKYPDMRPFAREHLLAQPGEYFAGPQLAPLFAEDAELAAAMEPPARGFRWKRVGPTVLFVLITLAFALPMLLARSPNPDRAAVWAFAGCVLTLMQIKVEGFNLPSFVTLPLLCGAAFGFCRAARAGTLAARLGRALAFGLIPCQAWILLGAPALVGDVGSVAYAVLPLALLAATDPLVPTDARAKTDRTLWWYAFTNLLLPVSFLLVDLVDQALGRDMVGSSLQGWLTLLVLLASVVGLILAAVRFGRLRKPMREIRPAVGSSPA